VNIFARFPPMKTKSDRLRLVAELAVAGLDRNLLPPEDHADFYEGLGAILPARAAEAARYAATCIRECHRARQDFLTALEDARGGAAQ
jgi:hypothetical protein